MRYALAACGYHTAGSTNVLPKEIHTIAIPPWGNGTTQYKLADYMAEALIARDDHAHAL